LQLINVLLAIIHDQDRCHAQLPACCGRLNGSGFRW
jgi:hypothetical protein